MNDISLIIGTLALAAIVALTALAFAVYAYLAVLEAAGMVEEGTTDLVVYRCMEPSDSSELSMPDAR